MNDKSIHDMSRLDWLMRFRQFTTMDKLEIVYQSLSEKLSGNSALWMESAFDHRRAELVTNKLFDKVPSHVWKLVD